MMKKKRGHQYLLFIAFVLIAILELAAFCSSDEENSKSEIKKGSIQIGNYNRTYLYYVPDNLGQKSSLIFVFHGSKGNGKRIRSVTGREFEKLADKDNFIVVYPDAYKKYWNGCRKEGKYTANKQNINDPEFVRQLIKYFSEKFNIDEKRVFAMGLSNGAHICFRLALEMPEKIKAIAAVAGSLPTDINCDCKKSGKPLSVMIKNGTDDPVNPFEGGEVSVVGLKKYGTVISTEETAEYFCDLAGYNTQPEVFKYPDIKKDKTTVEKLTWSKQGLSEINLLIIHGGGHSILQQASHKLQFLM